MTTPEDSAAVTPETARVIAGLEELRTYVLEGWLTDWIEDVDAAIDRLIVLDNARPVVKESLTPHPRELAMHQDAKRGNFRYQQEDDGA